MALPSGVFVSPTAAALVRTGGTHCDTNILFPILQSVKGAVGVRYHDKSDGWLVFFPDSAERDAFAASPLSCPAIRNGHRSVLDLPVVPYDDPDVKDFIMKWCRTIRKDHKTPDQAAASKAVAAGKMNESTMQSTMMDSSRTQDPTQSTLMSSSPPAFNSGNDDRQFITTPISSMSGAGSTPVSQSMSLSTPNSPLLNPANSMKTEHLNDPLYHSLGPSIATESSIRSNIDPLLASRSPQSSLRSPQPSIRSKPGPRAVAELCTARQGADMGLVFPLLRSIKNCLGVRYHDSTDNWLVLFTTTMDRDAFVRSSPLETVRFERGSQVSVPLPIRSFDNPEAVQEIFQAWMTTIRKDAKTPQPPSSGGLGDIVDDFQGNGEMANGDEPSTPPPLIPSPHQQPQANGGVQFMDQPATDRDEIQSISSTLTRTSTTTSVLPAGYRAKAEAHKAMEIELQKKLTKHLAELNAELQMHKTSRQSSPQSKVSRASLLMSSCVTAEATPRPDTATTALHRLRMDISTALVELERKSVYGEGEDGPDGASSNRGRIAELVAKLKTPEAIPKSLASAADDLNRIAVMSERNKVLIADAGAIPILVTLLSHPSAEVKRSSVVLLWRLANIDRCKMAIREAKAILPLIMLLDNKVEKIQEKAADVLAKLAVNDVDKRLIRENGGIPPLIVLLRSPSEAVQVSAVTVLGNLGIDIKNQDEIRQRGAIPLMVGLLSSHSPNVQEKAAGAMCNIAFSDVNQDAIREAGGIPPLVNLLSSRHEAVPENAARTLWYLAANVRNEEAIREAGGIPPLIQLLKSSNTEAQLNAAGAIAYLAPNERNQESIARAGGVPPLVALLESKNEKIQEKAASAFRYLGRSDENKSLIVDAGGIRPLVKLLSSPSKMVQESAGGALGNLAVSDANQETIREAGGIAPLVRLLPSCLDASRIGPLVALCNMSVNGRNKELIADAGAIKPLIGLLDAKDETVRGCAAGALQNLAVSDRIKLDIINAGAIPALINLLKSTNETMQMHAAGALRYVTGIPEGRDALKKCNGIPLLEKLATSPNSYISKCAALILQACARS
eukprot:CAMPEP_0184346284 /NCGR_PEP_ID=MMETSP1089-20130417/14560_1 /TAXON_ID=38269 ORGANISM="Gloeochaete wittrockiana, Strain SAG46.84" /NCGR_SAMPLE_ID=MMETSP1089 /ASSEMBLY_ACC=CAM_ASM_000445 /LENGTH=1069 /DNA_ID=CAMNT_0026676887 /DNA_START=9 /DNA_END=3218 /DNA_ORIENTATION=+